MRFRWNDWDAIAQIEIPLFETTKTSGVTLWNLLEEGNVDSITLLPGKYCKFISEIDLAFRIEFY